MSKTICISTSFKFYKEMKEAAKVLEDQGYTVLTPQPSHIRHGHKPDQLRHDKYDQATLEKWENEGALVHFANIKKCDVLYIFNQSSYIGPAVTVEIGYALALEKPIYAKHPLEDITIKTFIKAVVSPEDLGHYIQ